MSSLFTPSDTISQADVTDTILLWGPQFTAKTHSALGFPEPALCDVEGKGEAMAERFKFLYAHPRTIADTQQVLREVSAGKIPCRTFIFDSASAFYDKLVVEHTKEIKKPNAPSAFVTDFVTVNKRFLTLRDFCFGMDGKHIFFIAHSATKYVRKGNSDGATTFDERGLHFVGPESFRYPFGYIYRTEATGSNPITHPPIFVVEKTAMPERLPEGMRLTVPRGSTFYEQHHGITRGTIKLGRERTRQAPQEAAPLGPPAGDPLAALSEPNRRAARALADSRHVSNDRLGVIVRESDGDFTLIRQALLNYTA